MEREWPLVGRAAELERVGGLLRRGVGGVVLAGPAGVGKTRLAGECLRGAERQGFAAVRVRATQSATALPFGAFGAFLPDLASASDRTDMMRRVACAVTERGEGKPVTLLVDDAHLLDDASAALTHQLVSEQACFLLATIRSGEPAPDAVLSLWKDGLAERIEVQPLAPVDVEEILTAVLLGDVDGATVRVLSDRTRGNMLFLKEAVLGALEVGSLRRDSGLWHLDGDLPASARLVELVEARLSGLADADRELLSMVAVGEPVGVELFDRERLDALERRSLVRVHEDGRRLHVRLAHPLYGDVVRTRLSPLRTRAISRLLADTIEAAGGRRRDDTLRLATWRLDGGGAVRSELMLAAARQARRSGALPLAERLARAAVESGGGFWAHLLVGQLTWLQGRSEDAEAVLAALDPPGDRERAILADIRLNNLCWAAGQVDAALALTTAVQQTIGDPDHRDEVVAKRAGVLIVAGRYHDTWELVEPILPRAGGRAFTNAALYGALALCFQGRHDEALHWIDRGIAALDDLAGPRTLLRYIPISVRCFIAMQAGRLLEAEAEATAAYSQAVADGAVEGQGAVGGFLAQILVARGRLGRAAQVGREGAARYREMHLLAMVPLALTPVAHALALAGRTEEAESVLAELDGLPSEARWWQPGIAQARAWVAAHRGDLPTATAVMEEAILATVADGDLLFESALLHDLARLGQPRRVAPRLSQLTEVIDGPFVRLRAAHVGGLVAGDPTALQTASEDFEAIGADLLAAEAAADAAVAWRKTGDPRKAAAAERVAHSLASRCEGARTPALTAITARAALSARELEIARLAAAGVPNKQIATRLFLSLHTVQNKLHAAYEKLGIDGRSELADALEDY